MPERVLSYEEKEHYSALLKIASIEALKGAFLHGVDMPVGAAASYYRTIVGRGFASDKRTKDDWLHAEWMALAFASVYHPDTLGVTMEPCPLCQRRMAGEQSIQTVVFSVSREEVALRGLVNRHQADVFDNAAALPYEIIQLHDPLIHRVNSVLLDHTTRDARTGEVSIDRWGVANELASSPLTRDFLPKESALYRL